MMLYSVIINLVVLQAYVQLTASQTTSGMEDQPTDGMGDQPTDGMGDQDQPSDGMGDQPSDGMGSEGNQPPVISNCPMSGGAAEIRQMFGAILLNLSPSIQQLSIQDPNGDGFTIKTTMDTPINVTARGGNQTHLFLSVQGRDLRPGITAFIIIIRIIATDPFGSTAECIVEHSVTVAPNEVCSVVDRSSVIDTTTSLLPSSLDVTFNISFTQVDDSVMSAIRNITAQVMTLFCAGDCTSCGMQLQCGEFLGFCKPFSLDDVRIISFVGVVLEMKQITLMTIAVINPAVNDIIPNIILSANAVQRALVENNKAFFAGTILSIQSAQGNTLSAQGNILPSTSFHLVAAIVVPIIVVFLLLALCIIIPIIVVIVLVCKKKKRKITSVKPFVKRQVTKTVIIQDA